MDVSRADSARFLFPGNAAAGVEPPLSAPGSGGPRERRSAPGAIRE